VIPAGLKALLAPGSILFLLLLLVPGVLLLFRKKDGGRAGRIWILLLVLLYLLFSTPFAALVFVDLASPDYPPVMSHADARGATAIVLLGAGMELHRSRGSSYGTPTHEGSLRVLEAVRVYHVLGGVPIIATGGNSASSYSEAGLMALQLEQLGVSAGDIIKEERATNTRDHALFVPPILRQRGISQVVLVTSQQHIARAVAAFNAVGIDPVPSTPEVYVPRGRFLEMYLPSEEGRTASEHMLYDLLAWVYYKARGWV
jgi:uncharacterized SAM-binding protein YcdF (DUF218 family)